MKAFLMGFLFWVVAYSTGFYAGYLSEKGWQDKYYKAHPIKTLEFQYLNGETCVLHNYRMDSTGTELQWDSADDLCFKLKVKP